MTEFLTLTAVALPFVIAPGASFTLTLAHATRRGPPGWRRVAFGTAAGIVLLALAVGATELGAALATVPTLRIALGLVGATVLIGFGIAILVKAARRTTDTKNASVPANLVRWSFTATVTNPKALSLYALIVPTLGGHDLYGFALFASFAAIHIGLLTIWLHLTHQSVTRIPALARSPRLQSRLLATSGVLMISLGALTGMQALTQH